MKKKENNIIIKKLSYQEVISLENLKKGLARTKNNVSPGLDGVVKANFTDKKLNSLFKELKSQKFRPSPVKRVNIPKPNGGMRSLGIASQKSTLIPIVSTTFILPFSILYFGF